MSVHAAECRDTEMADSWRRGRVTTPEAEKAVRKGPFWELCEHVPGRQGGRRQSRYKVGVLEAWLSVEGAQMLRRLGCLGLQ